MADPKLFYIRDTRQIVGNCVLWWGINRAGYTTELDKAGKYTEDETRGLRETDVPIPCEVADKAATIHVRADCNAIIVAMAEHRERKT